MFFGGYFIMVLEIQKRDGRKVGYDINKITQAINKAMKSQGINDIEACKDLAQKVQDSLFVMYAGDTPNVEQIQDLVEEALLGYNKKVAKAYIKYRTDRTRVREMNSHLMQVLDELTNADAKDSDMKRENGNVDGNTPMGTMLKYGSESAKYYYDKFLLRPAQSKAHREGDIHIHDFDFYALTTTCCQIDLIKLFENGFGTGHGFLREPKDILSYSALACIAIQANQNDQHGGQSIPNFDYALAIGVRKTYARIYRNNFVTAVEFIKGKEAGERANALLNQMIEDGYVPSLERTQKYIDKEKEVFDWLGPYLDEVIKFTIPKSYKETDRLTYQAMEALVHNLNTMHSRAGAQVPFSSINYGTDTSKEGQMVMENLLDATKAGLGNGETPIFPIQIFKVKDGVNYNPGDPNYYLFEKACAVSAKRLFPNFSFIDAPFNAQYYKEGHPETEVAYMGCRTRVLGNVHDKSREIAYGRGNLSFTSINLPRLAIKSKQNLNTFYKLLDKELALVKRQLLDRFKIQCSKRVKNFPFLMGQGVWIDSENLGPNDDLHEVLRHGTLSIGFIGLAETLVSLIGKHHGESEQAQQLGLEIIKHMRDYTDRISKSTKLNFTLLATPAEGLSGRFVKMDKKRYGVIPGVTDKEYYTNIFHIPVYYHISAEEKIKLEAPYHALTNAGHITYVELDGNMANNVEAFKSVIRCMHDYGVGYGSVNHPVDRDPVCGYVGIIGDTCPHCGRKEDDRKFERIRRITGYLVGTLDRFNNAKRAEERDRVKHNVKY